MTKSFLRLDDRRNGCRYESTVQFESRTLPGVHFTVHRVSFGRRMELCRRVRDIGQKIEFLEAGEHFHDKVEANLLSHQIDQVYLEWGLARVDGLVIDGEAATAELLITKGPEDFVQEVVDKIKLQCGLTEEERKN